jgi:hypothetical protein
MLGLNQNRIKTGDYQDYEAKQGQKVNQFLQNGDQIQLLFQEKQCEKMNQCLEDINRPPSIPCNYR